MAGVYKKPNDCAHPDCQSGECKKCAWNPRSNYPAWHCFSMPKYRFRTPELVLTVMAAYVVCTVWEAGLGALLVIGIATVMTGVLVKRK